LLFNDEISKFFKQGARMIDLGSGSGSPAIPLKVSFPQITLTMIDSTFKKCNFLQNVLDELKIDGYVVHGRIEDFKGEFDIVTARAVAPLNELIRLASPLLKKGGVLLAFKGPNFQEEVNSAKHIMTRLKFKIVEIIDKNLEDLTRTILIIKKNN